MGKSQIGKAPRASAPECLLLLLCLTCLLLPFFSGIQHGGNGCGGSPVPGMYCDYLRELSPSAGSFNLWIIVKIISS